MGVPQYLDPKVALQERISAFAAQPSQHPFLGEAVTYSWLPLSRYAFLGPMTGLCAALRHIRVRLEDAST